MAIIKCKMCGGDLNFVEGMSTSECEYCGTLQTIPILDDEKKLIQFERAELLRKKCEFDKAAGIYETIVAEFRQEAEAYWGLVLCKYGIEYVDDPATGNKIPTCHRSSFESIMEDSDFEQVLENADSVARKVYRDEAKAIEEIRKDIISVSANEEPYDIFICYKETDEKGDRTLDSVLAQDVYDALCDKGYRVFFSRITLEDKLGVEYEPYIFAALNNAKIMLAFGTDYEYYNAVWVKNEWSRYLKLMAKDKEKHLIPCFKGIDAYDIPKEFAKLQAQDMGKVGAIQDLLRGIEKLLPRQQETMKKAVVIQQNASGPDVSNLLNRVFLFLENKNWDKADEYCEKVLDIDSECAMAYLGKLMADERVSSKRELSNLTESLASTIEYEMILRFGDEPLKKELCEYEQTIINRNNEKDYCYAVRLMDRASFKNEFEKAAELFNKLNDYKDSQERYYTCLENLKSTHKKKIGVRGVLCAGACHLVGLQNDGTVKVAGNNNSPECDVSEWTDIISVDANNSFMTAGITSEGKVLLVGDVFAKDKYKGLFDIVSEWRNVTAVSVGYNHIVGLLSDGSVVAAGCNEHYQCDIYGWTDIVDVSASCNQTIALREDGRVLYVGENHAGECDVDEWRDIISVKTSGRVTLGIRSDGRVCATGENYFGQCNVSGWNDIADVSIGWSHTLGLRADGTVVAIGGNDMGQCNVSGWRNVIAIAAGHGFSVGLSTDGSIMFSGDSTKRAYGWKLFDNIDQIIERRNSAYKNYNDKDLEPVREKYLELAKEAKKRKDEEALRLSRRDMNVCQHCGGKFKGIFSKTCSVCGTPKDYL
ncbi:MAG: TIR domain-containing protein [Clostridia bacterium]|nr:TIR domain-containing protein [Clostridia bacterium]